MRVPGDISDEEIERRYQLAKWDIRHGGDGELARRGLVFRGHPETKCAEVLEAIRRHGPICVNDLAPLVKRSTSVVWGHMTWLRKQNKVEVKYWVTSKAGRRVAVYGVKAHE